MNIVRKVHIEEPIMTNKYLISLTAEDRIRWSVNSFSEGLYALTSAGIDSALMLDHLSKLEKAVPVIFINTGFLPDETLQFRDELKKRYGLRFHEFGPTREQVKEIADSLLWQSDPDKYSKLTKLNPLKRAIKELDVRALLTGVRADQTDNRSTLGVVGEGNDGEVRIRPFIDWSAEEVSDYIDKNELPRNPLYAQGYELVGDWHSTMPGKGREGRAIMECGLHMVDGKLVKRYVEKDIKS